MGGGGFLTCKNQKKIDLNVKMFVCSHKTQNCHQYQKWQWASEKKILEKILVNIFKLSKIGLFWNLNQKLSFGNYWFVFIALNDC